MLPLVPRCKESADKPKKSGLNIIVLDLVSNPILQSLASLRLILDSLSLIEINLFIIQHDKLLILRTMVFLSIIKSRKSDLLM